MFVGWLILKGGIPQGQVLLHGWFGLVVRGCEPGSFGRMGKGPQVVQTTKPKHLGQVIAGFPSDRVPSSQLRAGTHLSQPPQCSM